MNKLSFLTVVVLLGGALPSSASTSDTRGGVHVFMPDTCEMVSDDGDRTCDDCSGMEQPQWYWECTRVNIFEDPEEDRDVPGRLENDTQWTGQREEFSDYLFR